MFKRISILSFFLLIVGFSLTAYAFDLNGVWNCDDGGTYYIRQIGEDIYWYGENDTYKPLWSNVASGKIGGVALILEWADVPKGTIMQNGILILQILSDKEMSARYKTGGFGGSHWTR